MDVLSARDPRYNANGTIDLMVTFDTIGEVPFTAAIGDAVGGPIYTRAESGEFGVVAEYVAPEVTQLELWQALQDQAQDALDNSDICVLRCYEHGVAVPAEWVEYRAALRLITGVYEGDAAVGLPVRPDYPEGT